MKIFPALIVLALMPHIARAEEPMSSRRLPANLLSAAPVIDGDLSDPVWSEAAKAEGFLDPFTGTPATDETVVLVGYDEQAMYFGFLCKDSNPGLIVAREIRSGVEFVGEDYVVIRMDPFFTRQDGNVDRYLVNAIGTKSEFLSAGRAAKREWRGEWDAKTKRLPDGWSAEIRIPWKMLSYPAPGPDGLNMSLNFGRYYARPKNRELWSDITSNFKADLDGIWEGVKPPRPARPKIQFLAYGLSEISEDDTTLDAGLDLRYPITPQMTLVGSINPDFKNVEQSIETIQFSRSERFLGDSRPFFAEGAGYTGTTHAQGIGRVFYSRRIEDFDLGFKVYGKSSPDATLGALVTNEIDGDTNSLLHLRQQFGPNTRLTAYGVSHDGEGRRDITYGAGVLQRFGSYYLFGEYSREEDRNFTSEANSYSLIYQIPNLVLDYRHTTIPKDYNPALGLISFRDRDGFYFAGAYSNNYSNNFLKEVFFNFAIDDHDRHSTGEDFINGYDVNFTLIDRNNRQYYASYENREFLGQRDELIGLYYGIDVNNRFGHASFYYAFGDRGGQDYEFHSVEAVKRITGKLDLGLTWNSEKFIERSDQYIASVGWEFDSQRALTGHYVSSPLGVNWYASFRNGGGTGRELYIILGDPNAFTFQEKLTVKLVWPF